MLKQHGLDTVPALATGPQRLLLHEPAAGINPSEKRELADLIVGIAGPDRDPTVIEANLGTTGVA